MFNSRELFKNRLSAHIKELSRYLRYIFNGHLAIAMLFIISALAVYYQQWLSELSPKFPAVWVISILFGIVSSYAPVRTLLQEPDLVFLIAAEDKMDAYFRNAIIYSYVTQLYLLLLTAAALGPLYFHAFPFRSGKSYLFIIVVLFIFKAWNLLANWWAVNTLDQTRRYLDQLSRFLLSMFSFYFAIKGEIILFLIVTILYLIIFLYDYHLSQKKLGIAWERLVKLDQSRMQLFYRIAHMFTEVPHFKNPIKKRRILVHLLSKRIPFKHKYTYDYLYRIAFTRGGDYFGMYIRLIIIGSLLIYFIPNEWLKLIFGFLFVYMSTFQMMTLYYHYRANIWSDIYPISQSLQKTSIIKWIYQLAIIKTVIFSLIFLSMLQIIHFTIMFVGGIFFTYLFINGYVKKRLA